MSYDSTDETKEHIRQVANRLLAVRRELFERAKVHDASKLVEPEKSAFDEVTPKLKELEYGSDEYRAQLRNLKPALDHHYAANSHHPEHYGDEGITGMSLFDIIEMYCDWQAAVLRSKDGNFRRSMHINKARFKMDDQLVAIFRNTFDRYGDLGRDIE